MATQRFHNCREERSETCFVIVLCVRDFHVASEVVMGIGSRMYFPSAVTTARLRPEHESFHVQAIFRDCGHDVLLHAFFVFLVQP